MVEFNSQTKYQQTTIIGDFIYVFEGIYTVCVIIILSQLSQIKFNVKHAKMVTAAQIIVHVLLKQGTTF